MRKKKKKKMEDETVRALMADSIRFDSLIN